MSEGSPNFRYAHPELYWPVDLPHLRGMAQPYNKQEIARARQYIIAALASRGIPYRFEVNDKWSRAVWLRMECSRGELLAAVSALPSVIRPGTTDQDDPNPFRADLFVIISTDQRLVEIHCHCESMAWSDELSPFQRELWLDVTRFGDEVAQWDLRGPFPTALLDRYERLVRYAEIRANEVHAVRTRLDRRGTMALVDVYEVFHPVRTHEDWNRVQRLRHTYGAWREEQLYHSRFC
ncbi:uncharacterized protein BO66DRAFT_405516 [Aspergillus aculeatinus CBS 121060]|uniref:Uncharacterized protein n=1 Tax=Aspergillus aculeatinus CBS 121060 TaxID=1448322 RepID=A0ACD1GWH5_9EURO|nr:hypothetical protein BO66DRAFT_405516 [Aspergillus aculeatinus CBS 121060]RAH65491.1 hypothetical protein BO66DRAFT_405516 [Aspergillus aculeatinus CBS 121060]